MEISEDQEAKQWQNDIIDVVVRGEGASLTTTRTMVRVTTIRMMIQYEADRRVASYKPHKPPPRDTWKSVDDDVEAQLVKAGYSATLMGPMRNAVYQIDQSRSSYVEDQDEQREDAERRALLADHDALYATFVKNCLYIAAFWTAIVVFFYTNDHESISAKGGAYFIVWATIITRVLWAITPERF